jgi:hypothetical protein
MGIVIVVAGGLLAIVALLVEMPWGSITGSGCVITSESVDR